MRKTKVWCMTLAATYTLVSIEKPPEMHDSPQPAAPIAQADPSQRLHLDAGLIFFLVLTLGVFVAVHHHLEAQFDFGIFYYASHMVLDGYRHALYNFDAQHLFQARFHRPPDSLFRNPPVALLPFLPLAGLPVLAAYAVWTLVSFGILYLSLKRLERETGLCFGNWPLLLSLVYVPVMGCLLHGQLSILMLAAFVFAYALWKHDRLFLGGLVLSIAALKFQLILGIAAVLLLRGRWKELAGLTAGGLVLLALSASITGIPALLSYPSFVLHSDLPINELPHMANWQGLLFLLGVNRGFLLASLSLLTILWAAWQWKDLDRGLCSAAIAAMLVSYHLTPQDLTLTILPIYLCAKIGILPRKRIPLFLLITFLALLAVVVIGLPIALLAIPLAAALWWVGRDTLRHTAPATT